MILSPAMRQAAIDSVLRRVQEEYVFPRVADSMVRHVRTRERAHAYDAVTSARALADSLTRDLRSVSHDLHLQVGYSAAELPPDVPTTQLLRPPPPNLLPQFVAAGGPTNFGFERAERLQGNIGYLEIRDFPFPRTVARDVIAAAMTFLTHTDALIIDVRRSSGGDPGVIAELLSYLLPGDSVLVNRIVWRAASFTDEMWTSARVPGPRYSKTKPVVVVTSGRSFSGAEAIAYHLQARKRATIVGESTAGAAHPNPPRRATAHFFVNVASGQSIDAVTNGDWEGKGVQPDIAVAAGDALSRATVEALRGIIAGVPEGPRRQQLENLLRLLTQGR
ncbi:MAG: S41 family peptidase [Gemmatimonadota bacterium]